MQARQMDADELQARLTGWLQQKMPRAKGLALENMARSGAGFSNETMLFDAKWTEGEKALSRGMVLRTPPRAYPVFPEVALTKQFKVMERLGKARIPVPRVLWLEEDAGLLGVPFYVMEKLAGTVVPEYPPYHTFGIYFNATPEQRARMWWGALENMARVHMLDWEKLGFSFLGVPGGGTGPVDRQLDYLDMYLAWMKEGDSQPIFEAALKWLKENRYAPDRVALCWGDPRLPNTMYNEETHEVVAILDWEMSFLGDPEADLAWFLFCDWQHSDGYGFPRTEGSPGREETIRRYEEITGFRDEAPLLPGGGRGPVLRHHHGPDIQELQEDGRSHTRRRQRVQHRRPPAAGRPPQPGPARGPAEADDRHPADEGDRPVPPDRARRQRLVPGV